MSRAATAAETAGAAPEKSIATSTGGRGRPAAGVDLTDADIVCHEGRQIVFVDPATAPDLDLSDSARIGLMPFLGSPQHAALSGSAALRSES